MHTDKNSAKELLAKHGYIVTVEGDGENYCDVLFPKKGVSETFEVEYVVARGKESGVVVDGEFWSCPEYAIRLVIISDISRRMRKLGIDYELIQYKMQDSDELWQGLDPIIMEPTNADEKERESFLSELVKGSIEDGFPLEYNEVAENHGVYTGYRLVKSFYV